MTLYNKIFIFFIMMFSPIISSFADTEIKLSAEDNQAISQLLEKIEPNKPTVINLTKPENEKGYIALLHSHGVTKQKHPDIFKDIETMKANQKAIFKQGESLEIPKSPTEPTNYFGNPRIVFSEDSKSISAESFGSLYLLDSNTLSQKSLQISLSIFGKDKNGNTKKIAYTDRNISGTDLRYFLISTNKYNFSNLKQFDSIQAVASFQGKKNGISLTPQGPILIKSNTLTGFDDPPLKYFQPYKMNNTAPTHVKNPLTKPVIVCLNRANPEPGTPNECDYGPTSPGNPTIKLEIIGDITFNNPIAIDEKGKPTAVQEVKPEVNLTLIGLNTGGACKARGIDKDIFWKHTKVNYDPAKGNNTNLSWDFSKNTGYADFGPVCWKNNERYILDLQATIVTMQGDNIFPVMFSYTNIPGSKEDAAQFIYPPIKIQY
ncbi:hypothetical protein [Photorhabdus sp. S9-53]|uniref:hypothetical protein n=2 Tax=Photorhabdus TaxID=29487 RepID=UPI00196201FA|nr:hypothetical protein [Photorhabdus sp. S9-53]